MESTIHVNSGELCSASSHFMSSVQLVGSMAAAPSSYDELLYGRSMSFSLSEAPGGPECSICSEHYDDQDSDLIPRNLSCGHSMCSSKSSSKEKSSY